MTHTLTRRKCIGVNSGVRVSGVRGLGCNASLEPSTTCLVWPLHPLARDRPVAPGGIQTGGAPKLVWTCPSQFTSPSRFVSVSALFGGFPDFQDFPDYAPARKDYMHVLLFLELTSDKLLCGHMKIFSGINFLKSTLHISVCDSENYM